MRALTICAAVAIALALVGLRTVGQDLVPTPDTIGGAKSVSATPTAAEPDSCRWRQDRLALSLAQRPLVVLDGEKSLDVVQRRRPVGGVRR